MRPRKFLWAPDSTQIAPRKLSSVQHQEGSVSRHSLGAPVKPLHVPPRPHAVLRVHEGMHAGPPLAELTCACAIRTAHVHESVYFLGGNAVLPLVVIEERLQSSSLFPRVESAFAFHLVQLVGRDKVASRERIT